MLTIGFIGTGIMGRPMARNLIERGYRLTVYNRTPERAEPLIEAGARRAATPAECARANDVVISIVSDAPDVEEVLFGPGGAVEGAAEGTTFVDMSTIAPPSARDLARRLVGRGFRFLDAPVSGGDTGAQKGTLTIMVGGEADDFERVEEMLGAMGSRVTHVGPHGAGQVTKACNQILCALNLLGVCEALALARRSELDLEKVYRVVTGGAGASWALEHLGAAIMRGDYAPRFMVRLLQKDLRGVLSTARELALPLAGTALCHEYFRSNEAHGEEDLGTQAMFRVLERLGNFSGR